MTTVLTVISVFASRDQIGKAVKQVQSAGIDVNVLSIIGKGSHHDRAVGFYTAGNRVKVWGDSGSFWGGAWGMLFGAAFFWIPGFGPLLVAGPFINTLLGALEGVSLVGGNSALEAALGSLGVQKNSANRYEAELQTGKLLLIAYGVPLQVDLSHKILQECNALGTAAYAIV